MSDTTHPSREYLAEHLPPVLNEFLRSGIEEAHDLIRDAREDTTSTYELDGITRHISAMMVDDTGRLVVKTFGGDLFLYRITLTEL